MSIFGMSVALMAKMILCRLLIKVVLLVELCREERFVSLHYCLLFSLSHPSIGLSVFILLSLFPRWQCIGDVCIYACMCVISVVVKIS